MWNRHIASLVVGLSFCGLRAAQQRENSPVKVPRGIPEKLWISRAGVQSLTPKKIALGADLFRDSILSADRTISCATCHDPATAYADRNRVAVGLGKRSGIRNTPTLLNSVFSDFLGWDGRTRSFEEQALIPLFNPIEMGAQTEQEIVRRLQENARYRKRFSAVFEGEGITMRTLLNALAAFERTLLSGNSAFDRFLIGEREALSASAERGWNLFADVPAVSGATASSQDVLSSRILSFTTLELPQGIRASRDSSGWQKTFGHKRSWQGLPLTMQ